MSLQCEHCQKTFSTNTALYKHKHKVHNKSALVLVNHSHNKMNTSSKSRVRPRSNDSNVPRSKRLKDNSKPADPQYDDELEIVDKYIDPGEKPVDSESRKDPLKYNSEDDSDLEIIDEFKDNDEDDDQLTVVDSYDDDEQSNDNLSVVDVYDDNDQTKKRIDYKSKYYQCLKAHKNQRAKFLKKIANIINKHKNSVNRIKKNLRHECEVKIDNIKTFHRKQMSDLEDLLQNQFNEKLQNMKTEHQKLGNEMVLTHKKEINENEEQCQKKLNLLNDQIKALQKDDEDLSSLSKAIFNCTTMEEIFEIQKLVKNHQLDTLVQNYLPTLQNLFLSLSYGIIPICQPQREKITDNQRSVVEQLQSASKQTAKQLLRDKKNEITNLFTIIKDSIKLARNAYNQYGSVS